jgi:16S rRNA C967 or C1407 C5-methylase (RsmB/RsmF family)
MGMSVKEKIIEEVLRELNQAVEEIKKVREEKIIEEVLKKLKQIVEEIKKVREEKIMSLDDLQKLGVNLLPATRTKNIEEAEEAVVNWIIAHKYGFQKRAIEFPIAKASNVYVVYWPDRKPNFRVIERNGTLVVLEADKPSLIYVKTDNFVYFNTFKPMV